MDPAGRGFGALAAIIFLGGLAAVWALGRRVFSPRQLRWILVGLVASRYVLFLPINGRMYGLLEAESAVATVAYPGLTSGRLPVGRGAAVFFAANLAGFFTHYYYFLLMGAIGLHAVCLGRRDRLAAVMGCLAGPAAIFAALWGPTFRLQLAGRRFGAARLPSPIGMASLLVGSLRSQAVAYYDWRGPMVIVPALILISAIKRRGHRYRRITADELRSRWRATVRGNAMLGASAFIGLFGVLLPVLSVLETGELKGEPTTAMTIFPLVVTAALALERAGDARLRALLALALLAVNLPIELRARHRMIGDPRGDRAWIRGMLERCRPGDTIICSGGTYFPIVDYYRRREPGGRGVEPRVFPEDLRERLGWYRQDLALERGPALVDEARALGRSIAGDGARARGRKVWVFSVRSSDAETARILTGAFPTSMEKSERIAVTGAFGRFDRIRLFEARGGETTSVEPDRRGRPG